MKKIFKITIFVALICAILCIPAFATNAENTDTPADAPEDTSTVVENTDGSVIEGGDTQTAEEVEKFYSGWIDKITDATMWANLLTTLIGMLTVIGFVKSKLGSVGNNVGSLLKGQVSKETIKEIIKEQIESAFNLYAEELTRVKSQLAEQTAKEDKLLSMFAIFMANAKINPYAKAEIMGIITGTKDKITTLEETVAAANEAIAAAIAAEEKVDTPSLDAICTDTPKNSAVTSHIELG